VRNFLQRLTQARGSRDDVAILQLDPAMIMQ